MSKKASAEILMAGARAARLATCHKKILSVEQRSNLERARLLLLEIIQKLAGGNTAEMQHVEQAMGELHPRTTYCQAMLIRDLADVCVTLHYLEQGRERTHERSTEAVICCRFLAEELGSL